MGSKVLLPAILTKSGRQIFQHADWGGEFSFSWDIKNVKGRNLHLHKTYDHEFWTTGDGHLKEMAHLGLINQLMVTSPHLDTSL